MELGTAEWVDWFDNQRLHTAIGDIPPHEHETNHYAQHPAPTDGCSQRIEAPPIPERFTRNTSSDMDCYRVSASAVRIHVVADSDPYGSGDPDPDFPFGDARDMCRRTC